jgi:branched-chain amino acid transport system ATP-binding protein
MLELADIRAGYGPVRVVDGVSFSVRRGEVLALLGANGAGKSTVLKVACGQLRPTAGTVRFLGKDATGRPPERLARAGLCCVPEGHSIFPSLTVAENLLMATHLGTPRAAVEEIAYARFPVLGERRGQAAGTLSGGEQQMLAMARGLSTNPAVLLLDELSMGLAPLIVERLYETVAGLAAAESMAIVVVEQFAHDVLRVADHAIVMAHGRVVLDGAPEQIAAGMDAAYLGLTPA